MSNWKRELISNAVAYAVLACLAAATLIAIYLASPALRRRWLPLARLRPGSWLGSDVFFTFCAYQGCGLIVFGALFQLGFFRVVYGPGPDVDSPTSEWRIYMLRCGNLSSPLVFTVTLGVIFTMLFARSGTRPHQFGLTWTRWRANFGLGLAAFILATPIVLGSYALMSLLMHDRPHPLTELGRLGLDNWEWLLLGVQALVAAPLLEEIVFRGILQGWLRRASFQGHLMVCIMTFVAVVVQFDSAHAEAIDYVGPVAFGGILGAGYLFLMFRMKREFQLSAEERLAWQPAPRPVSLESSGAAAEEVAVALRAQVRADDAAHLGRWADANATLAILGTAMLFAAFHGQNWPAPLPLLLLALVLGWLAQRTQSLIAPITLHVLFNFVAFIALYATATPAPEQNGNAETTMLRPSVLGSIVSSTPGSQLPRRK